MPISFGFLLRMHTLKLISYRIQNMMGLEPMCIQEDNGAQKRVIWGFCLFVLFCFLAESHHVEHGLLAKL